VGTRVPERHDAGVGTRDPERHNAGVGCLLLSVDFEDWHQLVRRRVGATGWEQPGPAVARQTDALLALFDGLKLKATFFILGMAARSHPAEVQKIAARGHEIGCHGDQHIPVHTQTPDEFATDLQKARHTIEQLTGRKPSGYRAPAFTITQSSAWAYDVLADEGFLYDASAHDTPAVRDRPDAATRGPHQLDLADGRSLWEFPVAVWHAGGRRLPIGGASYWALMPRSAVLRGLTEAGPYGGLYLHPQELDPKPLKAQLAPGSPRRARIHAGARAAQRNTARRRAPTMLRAIAERFEVIPYGEAYAELAGGARARSHALSPES
jgi:polysaccharide deacetylase family protein (PEP-CTERM system associated)